ncbi:hypothetical protein [Myxococcus stipitatus]|uniref:hypothetical protein n=1 Tax=Myxococcus stipitatus TaxID=83455 RepID=UPI0030D43D1E
MRPLSSLLSFALVSVLGLTALSAEARAVRNTTQTHVNTQVERDRYNNVDVNRNVNVNRDVDVHRDIDVNVDENYHPVAREVGATATAVAVGSVVRSLPPSCSTVVTNNITYQNCGGTWYQPRYSGTDVTYLVVNPP